MKRIVRVTAAALLIALCALADSSGANFSDEFTGPALDPAWVVRPGQGSYSFVSGNLRFFNEGPLSSPWTWMTTSMVLAHPFTGTQWEFEAKVRYNLVYLNSLGNSAGAQASLLIFHIGAGASAVDVTINRGVDAWYGNNTLLTSLCSVSLCSPIVPMLNPADAAVVGNVADGTYWFRIARDGGTITVRYSFDGATWQTAFSAPLPNPSEQLNELLISGQTWETVGSFADFDYIRAIGPRNAPVNDSYQVRYLSNLNAGDSYVNISNVGAISGNDPAGRICANIYVFDPNEEPVSCCACPVTPNGLVSLSARNSLISNPLTPGVPNAAVVKILFTSNPSGTCDAGALPMPGDNWSESALTLARGGMATATTLHANTSTAPATFDTTETRFDISELSPTEYTKLNSICNFIQTYASKFGLCKGCQSGGMGGTARK